MKGEFRPGHQTAVLITIALLLIGGYQYISVQKLQEQGKIGLTFSKHPDVNVLNSSSRQWDKFFMRLRNWLAEQGRR